MLTIEFYGRLSSMVDLFLLAKACHFVSPVFEINPKGIGYHFALPYPSSCLTLV